MHCFFSKSRDDRRLELERHYKFECCCLACLQVFKLICLYVLIVIILQKDWPTIKVLQYAQGGKETKHQVRMKGI